MRSWCKWIAVQTVVLEVSRQNLLSFKKDKKFVEIFDPEETTPPPNNKEQSFMAR